MDVIMHQPHFTTICFVQKWAHTFRDQVFHASINTNNGAEALNKVLKYSYLPRKRTMSLSSLVTLLIESFFPDSHRKYLYVNFSQTSQYRCYKDIVPGYLKDRPHSTIIHCLERKSKALKFSKDDIHELDTVHGIFTVMGSRGTAHTVSFSDLSSDGMPSCSCRDWTQHHLPCKHFFAVFQFSEIWTWHKLPQTYLESAYLCIDHKSLHSHFTAEENDSLSGGPEVETEDTACMDRVLDLPKAQVRCNNVMIRNL